MYSTHVKPGKISSNIKKGTFASIGVWQAALIFNYIVILHYVLLYI